MIDRVVVVLQNVMSVLLKVEPGSDSETCHDENQIADIKVEKVTKIQEEDPVLRTSPVIKTEHEVSCLCMCTLLGSVRFEVPTVSSMKTSVSWDIAPCSLTLLLQQDYTAPYP
jgi:hypothetical protein